MADLPRTRKRLPVREHSTFEESGGTWTARFDLLGISATGASEEEAWSNLRDAANEKLQDDEDARNVFSAWAEQHGVDEPIPEEELRARDELIATSHEASKDFRVLDASTFDDAIRSSTPVLIDFWAEWCMPCHMMAPVLKELADELAGRLEVCKLNVDDNKDFWQRLSIEGIPTVILFRDGEEVHRIVGAGRDLEAMRKEVEPHLL